MMKINIASITMVGQFPDGIDMHVRNLEWALEEQDHSYIITTSSNIKNFNLKNRKRCTFIEFKTDESGFVNFWKSFPELVADYRINPNWFLFMEQDILFFARPILPKNEKTIHSFLPQGDYKNILLNKELIHSRVWEGSQLIHSSIVKNAIKENVNFSFSKQSVDLYKNYGEIEFSMSNNPDTMDEFGLYCALKEKTSINHIVKASHLRGIESIHRMFPDFYKGCSFERLKEIQNKVKYVDIFLVALVYYVIGVWDEVNHIDFSQLRENSKKDLKRFLNSENIWLNKNEIERLKIVDRLLYF